MKKLLFKKSGTKLDTVEFMNGNQLIAKIDQPVQGILPHDLIHAIIETHFKIRGFVELVFAGQDPKFAMNADGEAWLSEAMVESIQGMLWSKDLTAKQFNAWVHSICSQRKVASFVASDEQFCELKGIIEDYSERWKKLPTGDSIEWTFTAYCS